MDRIEGKTKILEILEGRPGHARVLSKDDITAGDGARREFMDGKAALANATTCHVFEALGLLGIPLAFAERDGDSFITRLVKMIPVEIVVRNVAAGSYCKRNPDIKSGTVFDLPVVEFFYKTTGQEFRRHTLGCDDPLMIFSDDGSRLGFYHPGRPIDHERPLLEMNWEIMTMEERRMLHGQLTFCKMLALNVNTALSKLWAAVDGTLIDFKIECGYYADGQMVEVTVADVIDCDSWRVMWGEQQLSKQPFRDGMSAQDLLPTYKLAEELTRKFPRLAISLIRQRQ